MITDEVRDPRYQDEPPPEAVRVRDAVGNEATRGAFCPTCERPASVWYWVLLDGQPRSPDVATGACWLDLGGVPPFHEVAPGEPSGDVPVMQSAN